MATAATQSVSLVKYISGCTFKSDVVVCGADPSGRDDITVRFRERLDFVAYLVDFVTYNGNLSNFVKVSIWVPSEPSLL